MFNKKIALADFKLIDQVFTSDRTKSTFVQKTVGACRSVLVNGTFSNPLLFDGITKSYLVGAPRDVIKLTVHSAI